MWENYDYDDDDMELYEIECLREELYLDMKDNAPYEHADIEIDL
jgi:GTPase Era involved in 16S rRNA processing